MKTRDLILDELKLSGKINITDLSNRIEKKLDTTSYAVKKLVNDGLLKSERVHLGRSYNTFVWHNSKNGQLENNKIQVESLKSAADEFDQAGTLAKNTFSDPNQKTFQVENKKTDRIYENNNIQLENGRLKLPLEKLRSIYWDITIDKKTGKGKTDRHNKEKLIDKIIKEIDHQRGD